MKLENQKKDDRINSYQKKIVTIPNILSCVRIAMIPVIVWLYCGQEEYIWSGILLVLSGVTDVIDGWIARHFRMISDLGKVLDPIADKLTQAAVLICLLVRFPLMAFLLVILIIKEIYMSVTGLMIAQRTGVVLCARWHGKAATMLLYAMMVLHLLWPEIPVLISRLSIGACAVMIVVSFVLYGVRNSGILLHDKE